MHTLECLCEETTLQILRCLSVKSITLLEAVNHRFRAILKADACNENGIWYESVRRDFPMIDTVMKSSIVGLPKRVKRDYKTIYANNFTVEGNYKQRSDRERETKIPEEIRNMMYEKYMFKAEISDNSRDGKVIHRSYFRINLPTAEYEDCFKSYRITSSSDVSDAYVHTGYAKPVQLTLKVWVTNRDTLKSMVFFTSSGDHIRDPRLAWLYENDFVGANYNGCEKGDADGICYSWITFRNDYEYHTDPLIPEVICNITKDDFKIEFEWDCLCEDFADDEHFRIPEPWDPLPLLSLTGGKHVGLRYYSYEASVNRYEALLWLLQYHLSS